MPPPQPLPLRCLLGLTLLLGCSDESGQAPSLDAGATADAAETGSTVPPATQERLGAPGWTIHCAQSSYPAPTDAAGYQRATARFVALALSPEHTLSAPTFAVRPGIAHDHPYHDEPERFLLRGMAPPRAAFTRDELDAQGSHVVFCALVPADDAPRGVTEVGADRPMLAGSLFPMTLEHTYFAGPDEIGPYQEAYPQPTSGVQGMSHVVLRWTQQFAFEPRDVFPMSLSFRLTIRDAGGNGYRVVLPFRATDPGA